MQKKPEENKVDISKLPGIGELPMDSLKANIEKWKEKYGDVRAISTQFGEHTFTGIFRVPQEKDMTNAQREELKGIESSRELCRSTILYPEPMEFHKLHAYNWAFCQPISEQLLELTNLTAKATVKKL